MGGRGAHAYDEENETGSTGSIMKQVYFVSARW